MPKLFVLLISAMTALSSIAFVHVHHIPHYVSPHYVSRPVHVHHTTVPLRHARTVVHLRPTHVYCHPKPVYGPIVHDRVCVHLNPFWIPLLLSSHTTRTIVETVPVVETQAVKQPVVVQQIVQQQVPEYNSNGLLLIQTNFVSGVSN